MGWLPLHPDQLEQRRQRLRRFRAGRRDADGTPGEPRRHGWTRPTGALVPLAVAGLALTAALVAWLAATLPAAWSHQERLLHVLAAPGCGWARGVGLAPARQGTPGYHRLHDADGNGIACEDHIPDQNLVVKLLGSHWTATPSDDPATR